MGRVEEGGRYGEVGSGRIQAVVEVDVGESRYSGNRSLACGNVGTHLGKEVGGVASFRAFRTVACREGSVVVLGIRIPHRSPRPPRGDHGDRGWKSW